MPVDPLARHDAQLETAVSMMLKAIAEQHSHIPKLPLRAYPPAGILRPQPHGS